MKWVSLPSARCWGKAHQVEQNNIRYSKEVELVYIHYN